MQARCRPSWAAGRRSARSAWHRAGPAARRWRSRAIKVTPIDVQPDIATVLQATRAGCGVQRAPRARRRGWHDPGPAGGLANPLHPFRRPRLGAGDAEGQGQADHGGGRGAGAAGAWSLTVLRRRKATSCRRPMWSSRSTRAPPWASSSCARTAPIRPRNYPGGLGLRRESPCRILCCGPRADLRGDGRQGPRGHRHPARHGRLLRLRRKVCEGGLHSRPPGRN